MESGSERKGGSELVTDWLYCNKVDLYFIVTLVSIVGLAIDKIIL